MPARVAIIGAGFTGLAAAYDLARAGHEVQLYEAENEIGGLAGTFDLGGGRRLEKFYHHWFSSDAHVLDLLRELGVGEQIELRATETGIYSANSIFRLASPLDLLRFPALPFIDRVRTGLMALAARRVSDWRPLEALTAEEWIIRVAGKRSYEVIWQPLLHGKFGSCASEISAVWFWNKLKLRGSSRGRGGGERLAYFRGGFSAATNAIRERLVSLGVQLSLGTAVEQIITANGRVWGIRTSAGETPADVVLATVPLPAFLSLSPDLPPAYSMRAAQIRFLGNVCLVLRLQRSLSTTYWLNVADPSFPFVGVIEHTNLDDVRHYGGEHIAYLSKYLPVSDSLFSLTDQELFDYALPYVQRIFPQFAPNWVNGFHVWRAEYSQPIIIKHYSRLIPAHRTPIQNLWLATMAQVYPEDRGTNYAVKHGRMVAQEIVESLAG